ncbi:unnamed protein product [Cochlearia groenlandica]
MELATLSFDFTEIYDSFPKSSRNLCSAGKVSPDGGSFIDSILTDDKSEFVSHAKRLFFGENLESERIEALKLLSFCCGYDSLGCASSVINGDVGSVPYINDVDADTGLSPLHTAAESNSPLCVEMLLKRRARTDMRSKDGRALLPLELALCNGSLDVTWNPSGDSIRDLILLLGDKDMTVVKLLAEKTKELDVVAYSYAKAGAIVPLAALLIIATEKIREATIAIQEEESVLTKPKITIYESVIQEALRCNNSMQSVCSQKRKFLLREIELLQLFRAAVFSESVDKQTSPLSSIVQAGDEAVLELLINTDIDFNETDAEGNTLLHCSLKGSSVPHKQQTSIMNVLISHGARVAQRNKLGLSAVHFAAASGNLSAVESLVAAYPELVHAKTIIKETPLFFAVKNNHLDCVELLLQCGASTEIHNLRKQRPIELTQSQDIRFLLNPTNISCISKETELVGQLPSAIPGKGEDDSLLRNSVPAWLKKFEKWLPRYMRDVSDSSRETGYALSSLKTDFRAAFGMDLDHASVGFPKLIDFIKSFPRLCQVKAVHARRSVPASHWVMLPSKCSQLKGRPPEPLTISPIKPKVSSTPDRKFIQQAQEFRALKEILKNDTLSPNKPKVSSTTTDLICSGSFIRQAHDSHNLKTEPEPKPLLAPSYNNYHQLEHPVLETDSAYNMHKEQSYVSETLKPEPPMDVSYSYRHQQKHPVLETLAKIRNNTSIFFLREFDFYQSYEKCEKQGMCFWCNKRMFLWANFPCRHKLWCSSCKQKATESAGGSFVDNHRCVVCDAKVERFVLSPPFGYDHRKLSSGLANDAELATSFLRFLSIRK